MNAKKYKIISALGILLSLITTANADSLRDMIAQGNAMYAQQKYTDAISHYDNALVDNPKAYYAMFNKADCFFQLDDLTAASDLYQQVAAETKDMPLVAKAKYNLGNCYFRKGIKQKDSDLKKALEGFQASIDYWRQTLDIDSENINAARNIEIARLTIKDIIDQIDKQKQEQQKQQEKMKQLVEKLKKLLKEQQKLASDNQKAQDDTLKGDITPDDVVEQLKDVADRQSTVNNETVQASEDLSQMRSQQQPPTQPQQPQADPLQLAARELDSAMSAQQNVADQLDNTRPVDAKNSQDTAVKHIEETIKLLSQQQDRNQQQQQDQDQQQDQQQDKDQQDEQQQEGRQEKEDRQEKEAQAAPDTTAQKILDKEEENKKRRQMQHPKQRRVEKDW